MSRRTIPIHGPTLKAQYENGLSIKKIAELHEVSKESIYKRFKELKIPLRSRFERLCSKEKLKRMYCTRHYSMKNIAKKYNVSVRTVKNTLEKYEIPIRKSRAKEE